MSGGQPYNRPQRGIGFWRDFCRLLAAVGHNRELNRVYSKASLCIHRTTIIPDRWQAILEAVRRHRREVVSMAATACDDSSRRLRGFCAPLRSPLLPVTCLQRQSVGCHKVAVLDVRSTSTLQQLVQPKDFTQAALSSAGRCFTRSSPRNTSAFHVNRKSDVIMYCSCSAGRAGNSLCPRVIDVVLIGWMRAKSSARA